MPRLNKDMTKLPAASDIIRPIGTLPGGVTPSKPRPPKTRSLRRDIDALVCGLAIFLACSAFALSAYFFYGFTQTDRGFWTLASAFGLCFGLGSLAFIPLAITAFIARQSAQARASRKSLALVLLLFLPWICVSLVFIGWSALPKIYGISALLLSTALCFWAFKRLRHIPRS